MSFRIVFPSSSHQEKKKKEGGNLLKEDVVITSESMSYMKLTGGPIHAIIPRCFHGQTLTFTVSQ